MFLRPLEEPRLLNGTSLSIKVPYVAESTILNGCAKGREVISPKTAKIQIISSDISFQFRRLQFPLGLEFSMSISEAHGQFLEAVNIIPETKCFSVRQL